MSNVVPLLQARHVVASRPSESGQLQRVLQETTLAVNSIFRVSIGPPPESTVILQCPHDPLPPQAEGMKIPWPWAAWRIVVPGATSVTCPSRVKVILLTSASLEV